MADHRDIEATQASHEDTEATDEHRLSADRLSAVVEAAYILEAVRK